MPLVAAEQFVRSLTNQGYFDILSRALRDKVHRNDGRRRNWFLQTFYDFRQRSFELASIELYRHMSSAQKRSCLRCVGQLIVFEGFSITDGVRRPGAALLIHQRQEQTRIKPAAEKYSDRDITQQMAPDCGLV